MILKGDIRSMEWNFEDVEVNWRGTRFSVYGSAILEEDPPFEERGLDELDGTAIELTQINRHSPEYEDMPQTLFTSDELNELKALTARRLNETHGSYMTNLFAAEMGE
jgi:hypothetical protein